MFLEPSEIVCTHTHTHVKDDSLPPLEPHLGKERFVFFFEYLRIFLPLNSLCVAPHHYQASRTKY